jgi:hypothetical protein
LIVRLQGDELAFSTFRFNKFDDLSPMSVAQKARARKQRVEKQPQNSILNTIQQVKPLKQITIKMQVDIEEQPLRVPTVKLSTRKAGQGISLTNPQKTIPTMKSEATLPFIQDEPQVEALGTVLEEKLSYRPAIKPAKVLRQAKIQSKLQLSRGREVIGKFKVHKKAAVQRNTRVQEKHHMILRNRISMA